MSTILGNGTITFGDGTSWSSANIPWSGIVNRPTRLAQFTNDLGNYGSFLSITDVNLTSIIPNVGGSGKFAGYWSAWQAWELHMVAGKITLQNSNCNCNCNC
jgi:hypothetical protein